MKGNIGDWFIIVAFGLAFCVSTVLAMVIWGSATPQLNQTLSQANGGTLNPYSANAMNKTTTTLLSFDNLFVFIMFGGMAAILISSYFVNTHPIFLIISIIGFFFAFIILSVFGTIWSNFSQAAAIQATAAQYPMINMFWDNVELIGLIFLSLLIIILYTRIRGKGNNGYAA